MKPALKSFLLISFVVLADQFLKIWVHRHMAYGQDISVIGHWFMLRYIDNNGMAFGFEFADKYGKIVLTLFRIIAVVGICFLIRNAIRSHYHLGFILCLSLIMAGALGNIVDSVFYGVLYGYAPLFYGKVIDMLYFPLFNGHFPSWSPINASQEFTFFEYIFNLADASIFIGVVSILVFQNRYFKKA